MTAMTESQKPNPPQGINQGTNQGTTQPADPAPAQPPAPRPKQPMPKEIGGPAGPEPTRYGDWERKGRVSDF